MAVLAALLALPFAATAPLTVQAAPSPLVVNFDTPGGHNPWAFALGGFLIGGIGAAALYATMELKKHRPVKMAVDADVYIVKGEGKMDVQTDTFVRTHTTRVRIQSNTRRR